MYIYLPSVLSLFCFHIHLTAHLTVFLSVVLCISICPSICFLCAGSVGGIGTACLYFLLLPACCFGGPKPSGIATVLRRWSLNLLTCLTMSWHVACCASPLERLFARWEGGRGREAGEMLVGQIATDKIKFSTRTLMGWPP